MISSLRPSFLMSHSASFSSSHTTLPQPLRIGQHVLSDGGRSRSASVARDIKPTHSFSSSASNSLRTASAGLPSRNATRSNLVVTAPHVGAPAIPPHSTGPPTMGTVGSGDNDGDDDNNGSSSLIARSLGYSYDPNDRSVPNSYIMIGSGDEPLLSAVSHDHSTGGQILLGSDSPHMGGGTPPAAKNNKKRTQKQSRTQHAGLRVDGHRPVVDGLEPVEGGEAEVAAMERATSHMSYSSMMDDDRGGHILPNPSFNSVHVSHFIFV
jgi:hypothetical protein